MNGGGPDRARRARPWALCLALVLFVLGAERLVRVTPLFEAPDENAHADYVGLVLWSGRTPLVLGTAERAGRPGWLQTALGHHPPLYYRTLALGLRAAGHRDLSLHAEFHDRGGPTRLEHGADELDPPSPAVRALRWLRRGSILCGALSLVAVYAALRAAAPREPALAGLGVLVLATNGGWLRSHAVLDNGNPSLTATLVVVAALAHAVRRGRLGPLAGLGVGAAAGVALAIKLTALLCPALIVLAGAWIGARRDGRPWRPPLGAVLALAVALAAWAPWVLRNLALYGEPLATGVHQAAYAINVLPAELRLQHLLEGLPRGLFESAVGSIGWSVASAPAWARIGWGALALVAALGWAWGGRRVRLEAAPSLLLLVAALGALALLVRFNLVFAQPQARYAFAAAPLVAGCLGGGLLALGRRLPARARWPAGALLGLALAASEAAFLASTAAAFADARDPARARPIAVLDLHAPPARIVAPAPRVEPRPDGPPELLWEADGGPWSAVYWVAGGPRFGGTFETLGLALEGGRTTVPGPVWDYLEPGDELSIVLRRTAAVGHALAPSAGPTVGTDVARVRR